MRTTLLLAALTLLSACDGFLGGSDGDPLIVASDQGRVLRLDVTDDDTSQIWSAEVPASSAVTLLVDADTVYVAAGSEVSAFDLAGGESLWTGALGSTVVNVVGPVDGAVFALTFDDLVALDAADGTELWRQDLNLTLTDAADEALVAGAGLLVLGGDPIRSLDPATGNVLADYDTPDSDIRAMGLSGSTIFAGLADAMVALSPDSLNEIYRVAAADQVDNLALDGGDVFFSVLGGGVAGVDDGIASGQAEDGEIFQHLAIDAEHYLGVRADGSLAAWERDAFASCTFGSCSTAWEVDGGSATSDALVVGGERVYFSSAGILEAVAGADGGALWAYQTEGSVVAVAVP